MRRNKPALIVAAYKLEQNIGEQAIESEVSTPENEAEEIRRPENVVSLLQVDPNRIGIRLWYHSTCRCESGW